MRCWPARWFVVAVVVLTAAGADAPPLRDYFRGEIERIEANPLAGMKSGDEWRTGRAELQRRLREMLSLDPEPERTDLHATVTGIVDRPEFVVERLHFQSRPGLYVTANLYRPREVREPLPAILYVCGHKRMEKDGVIYGNKTGYQHHAAWYAANGFVCLILDTLQLGELPGLHLAETRERVGQWQSRGYTPAGVETWNAIRAIDYLLSRPEVDARRIGVTGRSGGGATSWWVGALDDRVAAVAPVAGITDLRDHVVDPCPDGHYEMGVIGGHCDCMYFVNTYRWDFDVVAALAAPKPLLVENTDHDPIFPAAGVRRIFAKLETVYGWYGARERLALVMGFGGHLDSPEIRRPSFAFFAKHLQGRELDPAMIEEPDRTIPVELLKVFARDEVPGDCRNATAHEWFTPRAPDPELSRGDTELERPREIAQATLRSKVLGGWPERPGATPPRTTTLIDQQRAGWRLRAVEFESQPGVPLRLWILNRPGAAAARAVLVSLDDSSARGAATAIGTMLLCPDKQPDDDPWIRDQLRDGSVLVLVQTRGTGVDAWPESRDVQIRRRFALVGQTLEGMRAWDLVQARAALTGIADLSLGEIQLRSSASAGSAGLIAWVAEPGFTSLELREDVGDIRDRGDLLNLDRTVGWAAALRLRAADPLTIITADPSRWNWARELGVSPSRPTDWPNIAAP